MRRMTLTALAVAAVLALAGCTSSDSTDSKPAADPNPKPTERTLVISAQDTVPLEHFFNDNGRVCTSGNIFSGTVLLSTTVTDEKGTVLAAGDFPERGGTFTKNVGCTMPLTLEVPIGADFYQIQIGDGTVTVEAEPGAIAQTVNIEI